MFGYILANLSDLSPEETERYHMTYCGLCRTLGKRHGTPAKFGLTYDLTFLTLLLSSLYEPEEERGAEVCLVHPLKKHSFMTNACTDYAADMTIILNYYKCMDDWQDDRNLPKRGYAALLSSPCKDVLERWPDQCHRIAAYMKEIGEIEKAKVEQPDIAANCFGKLMSSVFIFKKDRWETPLRQLGYGLGKFIYLTDAALDFQKDKKSGNYNPLRAVQVNPEEMKPILMIILGEACEAFELLPLVQDYHLLKNILYSGIWQKFNQWSQTENRRNKS